MKRKVLKVGSLAFVLTAILSVNVFASQDRSVSYVDQYYSSTYWDSYGVIHKITGNATVNATVSWDEGYAGWVRSAYFPMPLAYIDGNAVDLEYYGETIKTGSIAYQSFRINQRSHTIKPVLACDEYGDTEFHVECE